MFCSRIINKDENSAKEGFYPYFSKYRLNFFPYIYYPFWNMSTRFTRNQSYDLRGDPLIYGRYVGPWNISSWL